MAKQEINQLITFLEKGIQLKQMPRTGWLQRGVQGAENVAAHSYGVVLTSMLLAELIDQPFQMETVLAMATLHDLPEALTSDIPSPVKRFMPQDGAESIKTVMERGALDEMVAGLPFGEKWQAIWEEFVQGDSAESQLVHDADKIDMYLQAAVYQRQQGNRDLDQFWQKRATFYFAEAQAIYDQIRINKSQ